MSNNKYTNEFKKQIIDEYNSGRESFYSLERKYGISHSSIKNWYYNFYKKGINILELKENRGRKKEEDIDYKERYEILKKYQVFPLGLFFILHIKISTHSLPKSTQLYILREFFGK